MRPPLTVRLAAALLLLCAASPAMGAASKATPPHAREHAGVVTRVVDGDTLYLKGVETRIRLWGLDAPELDRKGGYAARRALRELAHGKRLVCNEINIDRYDRIVGQCFLPDGGDVTARMIESGTAREYVRYSGGYYSAGIAENN